MWKHSELCWSVFFWCKAYYMFDPSTQCQHPRMQRHSKCLNKTQRHWSNILCCARERFRFLTVKRVKFITPKTYFEPQAEVFASSAETRINSRLFDCRYTRQFDQCFIHRSRDRAMGRRRLTELSDCCNQWTMTSNRHHSSLDWAFSYIFGAWLLSTGTTATTTALQIVRTAAQLKWRVTVWQWILSSACLHVFTKSGCRFSIIAH